TRRDVQRPRRESSSSVPSTRTSRSSSDVTGASASGARSPAGVVLVTATVREPADAPECSPPIEASITMLVAGSAPKIGGAACRERREISGEAGGRETKWGEDEAQQNNG